MKKDKEMNSKLVMVRDSLLIEMKEKKDEPNTYYDGVLDMFNETRKIIEGEKYSGDKSVGDIFARRNSQG